MIIRLIIIGMTISLVGCNNPVETQVKNNANRLSEIQAKIDNIDNKFNALRPNWIEQKVGEKIEVPRIEESNLEVCKHLILPRGRVQETTYEMLSAYGDNNNISPYLDEIFVRVLTTMIWCFENT